MEVKATLSRFAVAALVAFAGGAAWAQDSGQPPEKIKVRLAVGFGYHVCDDRGTKLPPLAEAFLCSGLEATPHPIEIELTKQNARKPTWLFYEASHKEETSFNGAKSTLELNVAYADLDGAKWAYIDGRLISEFKGKKTEPIYFRFSGQGGFENLQYSSTYGARVPMLVGSSKSEYAPYVAIQAAK